VSDVRPLASVTDVIRASRGDVYVRCNLPPDRPVAGWALDGPGGAAVAWTLADRETGWLTSVGAPETAARVVVVATADLGTPPRALTVPRHGPVAAASVASSAVGGLGLALGRRRRAAAAR